MTDGKGGEWILHRHFEGNDSVKADFSPLAVARSIEQTRSPNLIALGFMGGTIGLNSEIVMTVAEKRLSRRGNANLSIRDAIQAGYDQFSKTKGWYAWQVAPSGMGNAHLILNGNEAITLGALAAGIRFFCGYPITPASSILETMLAELPKLGGTAIQMEDEIAALAACLGASYAGTKAMVATSGPGFALMSELMNLATVAELPITIVDVQRSGPATGQPTKSEQADLLYALHGSPGDSPRLVLAPATIEEAFTMTIEAVNLAEQYQMPVILLSDGALANRIEAIDVPDWNALPVFDRKRPPTQEIPNFERYMDTPTGVSAFSIPGVDDLPYIAGGMEHGSTGAPSATAEGHFTMSAKRANKVEAMRKSLDLEPSLDTFTPGMTIGIVGWGSTHGAIEEARRRLSKQGIEIGVAHIRHLNPLPERQLVEWMKPLKRVIVAEENRSGQLASLIKYMANGRLESLLPVDDFEVTPELVIHAVMKNTYHLREAVGN